KPGVFVAVILWSIFFGVTALLFLPGKAIVTAFGSLLGVSVSEASTAAGLISMANKTITSVASQIGLIVNPEVGMSDPFVSWLLWAFVVTLGLLCLPAFFLEK